VPFISKKVLYVHHANDETKCEFVVIERTCFYGCSGGIQRAKVCAGSGAKIALPSTRRAEKWARSARVPRPVHLTKSKAIRTKDIFSGSGVQEVRYASIIEREMILTTLRA